MRAPIFMLKGRTGQRVFRTVIAGKVRKHNKVTETDLQKSKTNRKSNVQVLSDRFSNAVSCEQNSKAFTRFVISFMKTVSSLNDRLTNITTQKVRLKRIVNFRYRPHA